MLLFSFLSLSIFTWSFSLTISCSHFSLYQHWPFTRNISLQLRLSSEPSKHYCVLLVFGTYCTWHLDAQCITPSVHFPHSQHLFNSIRMFQFFFNPLVSIISYCMLMIFLGFMLHLGHLCLSSFFLLVTLHLFVSYRSNWLVSFFMICAIKIYHSSLYASRILSSSRWTQSLLNAVLIS